MDWKKPEDDGGAAISHYVVEKMDTARGSWIPCGEFADCHGKINGLTEGHEYKFRIKAVNMHGESIPLTADEAIVAKNPYGMFVIMLSCLIQSLWMWFCRQQPKMYFMKL